MKLLAKTGLALVGLACSASVMAADLYVNFSGLHVVDGALARFSALVVDEGKVRAVGSVDELAGRFPAATRIDLNGAQLLPGLIDGHGHVTGFGAEPDAD